MKFRTAFLAILSLLIVHIILMIVQGYRFFPDIDILMHFLGGLTMGMLGIAIHHDMTDAHDLKRHPDWYRYLFVIGFVMLTSVAWEFLEYLMDNTIVIWYQMAKNQMDLADTMLDFVMDAIGGSVAYLVFKKKL